MVSGLLLVAERGHDQCVNHWGARHPSCTAHIHQQGLNGQWSSLGDDQSASTRIESVSGMLFKCLCARLRASE